MKKTIYEVPSTRIISVRVEGRILENSVVSATRSAYAGGDEEEWI